MTMQWMQQIKRLGERTCGKDEQLHMNTISVIMDYTHPGKKEFSKEFSGLALCVCMCVCASFEAMSFIIEYH